MDERMTAKANNLGRCFTYPFLFYQNGVTEINVE